MELEEQVDEIDGHGIDLSEFVEDYPIQPEIIQEQFKKYGFSEDYQA